MIADKLRTVCKLGFALALLSALISASPSAPQEKVADQGGPWGKAVDGLACRLTVQPKYAIGQSLSAVFEIKNVSDKKRFIMNTYDLRQPECFSLALIGPKGRANQNDARKRTDTNASWFQPIEPGEVKRVEVSDLREFFAGFDPWTTFPVRKPLSVTTGKYELQCRFASPKIPPVYNSNGLKEPIKASPEMLAGEWSEAIEAVPVSFELLPLGKEELVVHEWGVFTVLNDSKYANANRADEWNQLPAIFYRQFPKERLPWFPSAWDKPIVYFYAKPHSMHVNIKVTFDKGTPVVWWPGTSDPVDNWPGPQISKNNRPFRWLVWDAWLGERAPFVDRSRRSSLGQRYPLATVKEFPLPTDSWLNFARLPSATLLTVVGTTEKDARSFPGASDRSETERFLYYDGLVPAPDYLHCEKTDAKSVTLRNGADFDFRGLFVVDRRIKGQTAYAFVDGAKQPFKAGSTRDINLESVSTSDWPAVGVKQVRQALLDAGLFEPEADSLLKIWQKRLLEADGLVAFHILPVSEYDRMLPLDILPAPPSKPVRVGIGFHPNLEIEPALRKRVSALTKDLDSDAYAKRAAASKELSEIGPVAIGMLRAELHKQPSLEMRRRIESIIDNVDGTEWMKAGKGEERKSK